MGKWVGSGERLRSRVGELARVRHRAQGSGLELTLFLLGRDVWESASQSVSHFHPQWNHGLLEMEVGTFEVYMNHGILERRGNLELN